MSRMGWAAPPGRRELVPKTGEVAAWPRGPPLPPCQAATLGPGKQQAGGRPRAKTQPRRTTSRPRRAFCSLLRTVRHNLPDEPPGVCGHEAEFPDQASAGLGHAHVVPHCERSDPGTDPFTAEPRVYNQRSLTIYTMAEPLRDDCLQDQWPLDALWPHVLVPSVYRGEERTTIPENVDYSTCNAHETRSGLARRTAYWRDPPDSARASFARYRFQRAVHQSRLELRRGCFLVLGCCLGRVGNAGTNNRQGSCWAGRSPHPEGRQPILWLGQISRAVVKAFMLSTGILFIVELFFMLSDETRRRSATDRLAASQVVLQ